MAQPVINSLLLCLLLQIPTLLLGANFSNLIINDYGSEGKLSEEELDKAISHIRVYFYEKTSNHSYAKYECINATEIYKQHNLTSPIDKSSINTIASLIQYQMTDKKCNDINAINNFKRSNKRPPTKEIWGYGLLFVTLINICASLGIIVIPFMNYYYYKLIMAYMVALAVGSLAGSAILVLIPEAMHLNILAQDLPNYSYIWQGVVIFGGIYTFFILERILKYFIELKVGVNHAHSHGEIPSCSMNIRREPKTDSDIRIPPELHIEGFRVVTCMEGGSQNSINCPDAVQIQSPTSIEDPLPQDNGKPPSDESKTAETERKRFLSDSSATSKKRPRVAPVAWMIIFGDGVHNFIDGLSLGAAFSKGTFIGISLSIAVLCEELPHELGDFAILLNSGMKVRNALVMNLISASTCYIGFVVGALLGEMPSASTWVFAFAGGMFLYISLVDMLPEVNHAMESKEADSLGKKKLFFLQNLGLLTGFGLLFLMAYYGGDIQIGETTS